MAKTVNVTVKASDQNGNPVIGAIITATLTNEDVDTTTGEYILPEVKTTNADSQGVAVIPLWPNALGSLSTRYTFTIQNPDTGRALNLTATIPDQDSLLHVIAALPAYPGKPDGMFAVSLANKAKDDAIVARDIAVTARGVAEDQASMSTQQANVAIQQASIATGRAAVATEQAGISTQQAVISADKAKESADSALLSQTIAAQVADYPALRAYNGPHKVVYVTGILGTVAPSGIAGHFLLDSSDTTSVDNGGTIIVDESGRRRKRAYSGDANISWFGAVVADATVAIQAALNSEALGICIPEGEWGVKSAGVALTLSANGKRIYGPGSIVPIANASGYAPAQTLLVSGSRNVVEVEIWNKNDLTTQGSDGSNEYPMDGIRVTGKDNIVSSRVWHFVAPIVVKGGAGNHVTRSRCTVKQKSNLAWPNDGILFFNTASGTASFNRVGMSTGAAVRDVIMSDVAGASTSLLRTGITVDAITSDIKVLFNEIGEGFVAGIHAEGTGGRHNDIYGNTIWKQKRNAINCAGKNIAARFNWCYGTFNTDATVNLSGIIGSVESDSDITDNWIYCDTDAVDGIHMLANADRINIRNNRFIGTFKHCVSGIANTLTVKDNMLEGTAKRFASIDKPAAITNTAKCSVDDNVANFVLEKFAYFGSGMPGKARRNKINLGEGYVAADGVIEFGGGYLTTPSDLLVTIADNECLYVGSTVLSGAFAFVKSSSTGGAALRGSIERNTFPTTIFSQGVMGTFVTGERFTVERNSSNGGAVNPRRGTFTLGTTAITGVANNSVTPISTILLTPTNAAAATLMQGAKSLFVLALVAANRFEVRTADNTAPAGTETFSYTILD